MPQHPFAPPPVGRSRGSQDESRRPIASALPLSGAHVEKIDQSHERCQALGLSRIERPDFSPLGRSDLTVVRDRNQRLYAHAAPVMEMLFEQIVNSGNMVVLTDATGTILHSIGDDDFLGRAAKVALAPGANWSEQSKGTNAVGTALIEELPTLVHADEHYMHANHFLTCSAAPILDPRGNILGVLDVSGDQRSYHQHTMGLVKMSARMIENHWLTDDYRNVMRLHFHSRVEFIGTLMEGILAVSQDGKLVGANRGAAFHYLSWSDFSHPWPWWALSSRAVLLMLALLVALQSLARRPSVAQWGNALLVGLSAFTWGWVSLASLALRAPMVDSNTLAHAGWVLWVVLMLQRQFVQSARRDKALRDELAQELARRTQALEEAYAAKAQAQREQAAGEQRQRLLQDLHDGLGARLLTVRLQARELSPTELAQAIDECLLEMRLSVDTLTEDQGDLGVLLGSWRHRVTGMLRSAGLEMDWRVMDAPVLPCLRGSGALELVRLLQEALANTVRHARARRITVGTQRTPTHLVLWWVDDGQGLNPLAPEGMGRRNMAARAQRLGGRLEILSPAPRDWLDVGTGTALALYLPLPPHVPPA